MAYFAPTYGYVPPPAPAPTPQVEYIRPTSKTLRSRVHVRRQKDERYVMGVRMGHEVAAGVRIDNLATMLASFSARGRRRFWLGFALGLHREGQVVRREARKGKNLAL